MSNKKDNKLDFRNVKNSQFDGSQTQKMAFSELQSAYRQYETNAILKDAYTHFVQELNANSKPTKVQYYQATDPTQDRINVRADNNGDLSGKYIILQESISKKTYVFWFKVSGVGTAPGIGDAEIEVSLNNNDPASLVAYSLKTAINNTSEFTIINSEILSAKIDVEYFQFGETDNIDVGTTGFLATRIKEGSSLLVGQVELSYDVDGSPIYNGNKLKGLIYNPYTASFDVEASEITANIADKQLTSSTVYDKQALDVNIADQVIWDSIETTFPDDYTDLYTYKNAGEPVQTIRVSYADLAKKIILLIEKTRI